MAEVAKWYIVHTYSGYENAVQSTIIKYVDNRGMRDLIQEVNIPLEKVTEITEEGTKTVERKIFPGYVLVKMILTDETWHIIRNIRGVTGFVGSGNKAIPLTDAEIEKLGVEKNNIKVSYDVGDTVEIIDGALKTFTGIVQEIDIEKNSVQLTVSMFGRETSVTLELNQVELVEEE